MRTTLLCFAFALLGLSGRGEPAAAPATAEIASLAEDLSSASLAARRSAAEKLGRAGPSATAAVPALIASLTDDDDMVQRHASWALGKIGAPAEPIVAALAAKLRAADTEWAVRHNAALSLSWIGQPAIPALQKLLEAPSPATRGYAVDALIRIEGPVPDVDFPAVLEPLLGDADVSIRAFAATLAGRLGSRAQPLADTLIALLADKGPHVRQNAIVALREIGPLSAEAAPAIRRAMRSDADQWVRIGAAQIIARAHIPDTEKIGALIEAFGDEKDRVGMYAVQSLASLGAPAVPALRETLKAEPARLRLRAAETLAYMGATAGPEAAAAASSLVSVLAHDQNWEVRSLAANALGALGCDSEESCRALETASNDAHEIVRLNARDALARLRGAKADAPPETKPASAAVPAAHRAS